MNYKRGFSLTELTAAMTIIALVASTATASSYLRKNAKLVSIMDEIGKLNQAYVSFKSIYNEVPGDMFDGTTKFGTSNSGINTLNGNGNGIIDMQTNEQLTVLQHLALAGLITGNFTGSWSGIATSSGLLWLPGPVALSGYYFGSFTNSSTSSYCSGNNMAYMGAICSSTCNNSCPSNTSINNTYSSIWFAGLFDDNGNGNLDWSSSSWEPYHPVLTPIDMAKIDNKYDDGLPNTGKIMAANAGALDDITTLGCFSGNIPSGTYITGASFGSALSCFLSVVIEYPLQ